MVFFPLGVAKKKEKRKTKKKDLDGATGVNYGVASPLSWSESQGVHCILCLRTTCVHDSS